MTTAERTISPAGTEHPTIVVPMQALNRAAEVLLHCNASQLNQAIQSTLPLVGEALNLHRVWIHLNPETGPRVAPTHIWQSELTPGLGRLTSGPILLDLQRFPATPFSDDPAAKHWHDASGNNHTRYYTLLAHHAGGNACMVVERFASEFEDNAAFFSMLNLYRSILSATLDRVAREQSLANSEARYRGMVDALPDLFFRMNLEGVYLDCHVRRMDLLIAPPSEFLGKRCEDFLPPPLAQQIRAAITKTIETGQNQTVCYSLPLPSGEHTFEARLFKAGDREILTAIRDTTEETRVRQALEVSEQSYRRIVDTVLEGIWIVDAQWNTVQVNPQTEFILGVPKGSMLGRPVLDYIAPDHRDRVLQSMERRSKGISEIHEQFFVRGDGKIITCLMSSQPLHDEQGQFIGGIAMMMDISARKQQEEIIRQSERQFRTLFQHAGDALFVVNASNHILDANSQACQLVGLTLAQLKGRDFFEFVDDHAITEDSSITLHSRPRPHQLKQVWLQAANGTRCPVEVNLSRMGPDQDAVVLVSVRDHSEHFDYEEKLRLLAFELADSRASERRAFASELHDGLGQILSLCKLRMQTLQSREAQSDPVAARDVLASLDRAIDATRALTIQVCPPSLYQAGLVPALRALAEILEARHHITFQIQSNVASLRTDERTAEFLYRSCQELFTNIIKHSQATSATVRVRQNRSRICIVVQDDGTGIPPASAKHDQFGLFSIREDTRMRGGVFSVHNLRQGGTRAVVCIPTSTKPLLRKSWNGVAR